MGPTGKQISTFIRRSLLEVRAVRTQGLERQGPQYTGCVALGYPQLASCTPLACFQETRTLPPIRA